MYPILALSESLSLIDYEQDAKDLSFSAGDVIEIVAETNADWWEGKIHGKQGLFPSNHVEKLSSPITPSQPMNEKASAVQSQAVQKPVYKPFKAAYHGTDVPPPVQVPQVNSVGLAQDPGQAQKKSKYGALGNTVSFMLNDLSHLSECQLDGEFSSSWCGFWCR